MKTLKQPQPGDLFYIPAWNREGTFGFVIARHIELIPPNIGYLIEVFAKFFTEPPKSIEEVPTKNRGQKWHPEMIRRIINRPLT